MSDIEASTFDVQKLRRGLGDLAALSALPVVWSGSDPRRIAESLADALLHMLHLELVYILVRDRAYEIPLEVAHTVRGPAPPAQAEEIGRALDPWLNTNDLSRTPSSIANPLGNGITRIICPPFGIEARGGVLVACSPRADFPTEVDRLLLGVAANQVAVLLDRRRTEDALRESEERFRGTFENAGVGIADCDLQGRFLRVNQKLCEIVGYTREELLQKTWQDITHPDDLAAGLEQFLPLPRGEQPGCSLEMRYVRKDGSLVWADVAVSLGRDAAGRPAYVIAILQNISERKRLEEELSQANARLELALRSSRTSTWEIDIPDGVFENGRVTYGGDWELLGYGRPELPTEIATAMVVMVHPDDRERLGHAIRTYLSGETREFEIEFRSRHKDGSDRWRLTRGMAVRDPAGRPIRLIGSSVDITDLKRAEEALRASEQRFRTFVDHATDAFFLQDDQLVVVDVNRQACQSLGYTRDELVGMTPLDFDPDVTPAMLEEFGRRLDTGEMLVFESRHRRNDGSVFPVEVRGRPFWEGGRRLTVALARDITEHKRAEEALRESERRFRILAEALPHMVWTAQPDGATDYYNARTTEYTGLTTEQLRGWGWRSTIHPEDLPRCLELWTRSIATGEPYEIEFPVRRADGAFRWHLARALPLRDESGRITKWFGSCIDIDDQKRAQEALREAKEAAEAANWAKDEFLANVSHEIRTPMNAILGMTELVMDTPLTRDQRQCLKTVKSAADNLLGLMNDLLDFSKIEAGKLELDPDDFSLRAAVGDTLRALAVRAHTKGLELIYDLQPEVPDALVGDAGRLRQVLLNLVGNAIKFTDAGEVVVRVEVAGAATPEGEVGLRFTVRDTGMGIPRDQHERIFRAFEQEDSSTTRRYGGTGLGLTIAARLVALMRGQITVESEPGRGSTFSFTARFGLQPHPPEQVPVRPPASLRNLPVLVVDDSVTNRHILEEWLRGWQMEPAAVGDGLAALDALWDAVSVGRPYALVLLDARMPDTDGLALAAKIRKRAELAAMRIILLTSGERPGDWDRIREQRIDAHLLKPVQQDELLETIYRVMSRANGDAPPAAGPWGGGNRPRRRSRPRRTCTSWWPRTTRSTRNSWNDCSRDAATACGWRTTAGRRWPWRKRAASTCCSWTSTCRSWTASRSSRRSASVNGPRGAICRSSP